MTFRVNVYDKIKGETVEGTITEYQNKLFGSNSLFERRFIAARLEVNGKTVGTIKYTLEKDHLNIQMIHNDQSGAYDKVGQSLVQYAFQKSMDSGKEGRIEVGALDQARGFWETYGFELKKGTSDVYYLPAEMIRQNKEAMSKETKNDEEGGEEKLDRTQGKQFD